MERGYDNIDYLTVKTRQELNRESGSISWSNMRLDYDLSQFEYNGVYELHPVFRITGTDEWFEIDVPVSETIPTVTITGAKNRDFAEVNFSVNSTDLYVGETLQINHDSNYQGKITYSSSNVNVATVDDQRNCPMSWYIFCIVTSNWIFLPMPGKGCMHLCVI